MRLPRPRFTIAHLMVLIVIAGLALAVLVMRIERNRRIAALQVALANHRNAVLTRKFVESNLVAYASLGVQKIEIQVADQLIASANWDLEFRLNQRGYDERAVEQARVSLKRAQQKRAEYERYPKELKDEVAKAVAAEQAAKAAYDQLNAAGANPWW